MLNSHKVSLITITLISKNFFVFSCFLLDIHFLILQVLSPHFIRSLASRRTLVLRRIHSIPLINPLNSVFSREQRAQLQQIRLQSNEQKTRMGVKSQSGRVGRCEAAGPRHKSRREPRFEVRIVSQESRIVSIGNLCN
jgi:hypothetical protein